MKIRAIVVAVLIAAIVIVLGVCVVRGVYTVGEGLLLAVMMAIVAALVVFFGVSGGEGDGDGWFGDGGGE